MGLGKGTGRRTGGALTPGYRVVPQAGLFGRGGEGGAVELTAQADLSAGDALTLCYAEVFLNYESIIPKLLIN